jgi:hypothetical protein
VPRLTPVRRAAVRMPTPSQSAAMTSICFSRAQVSGAPFLMSMGPERVSGTFNLTRQDEADEMIRRLTALKAFLMPPGEAAN